MAKLIRMEKILYFHLMEIGMEEHWEQRCLVEKKNLKKWITNKDKDIIQLPFPYPWTKNFNKKRFFEKNINRILFKRKINPKKDISGIILETFQGWGTIFYPKSFIHEIKKFSKKNNILIAFDEIQSGFGRTGKLFGYMHYNIKPDIVCCGKGAGSGFPLSIVLGKKNNGFTRCWRNVINTFCEPTSLCYWKSYN